LFAEFAQYGIDLGKQRWSLFKINRILSGLGKLNKREADAIERQRKQHEIRRR